MARASSYKFHRKNGRWSLHHRETYVYGNYSSLTALTGISPKQWTRAFPTQKDTFPGSITKLEQIKIDISIHVGNRIFIPHKAKTTNQLGLKMNEGWAHIAVNKNDSCAAVFLGCMLQYCSTPGSKETFQKSQQLVILRVFRAGTICYLISLYRRKGSDSNI